MGLKDMSMSLRLEHLRVQESKVELEFFYVPENNVRVAQKPSRAKHTNAPAATVVVVEVLKVDIIVWMTVAVALPVEVAVAVAVGM